MNCPASRSAIKPKERAGSRVLTPGRCQCWFLAAGSNHFGERAATLYDALFSYRPGTAFAAAKNRGGAALVGSPRLTLEYQQTCVTRGSSACEVDNRTKKTKRGTLDGSDAPQGAWVDNRVFTDTTANAHHMQNGPRIFFVVYMVGV